MKKITLLAAAFVLFCVHLSAQSSFANYVTANNATWAITKYFLAGSQEDKKDLFKNYTFRFSKSDTTTLSITNIATNKNSWKGFWNEQPNNNNVDIFLPTDLTDSDYNQIAILLNKAPLQEISATPSLLTLKMQDLMGEIVVEFSLK